MRPVPLAPRQVREQDAPTAGVVDEISDAARSMFAQMRKDGIAAQSFDLHLDLQQLGIKVAANGSRSMEGHSLTVDLHVEAVRGSLETDDGQVSFEKLSVSFSLEETWIRATEDQPTERAQPKGGLVDGLKKLVSLLDRTRGKPGPEDGLGELLAQIGRALEAMAKRLSDAPARPRVDEIEGFELRQTVELHELHFEVAAVHSAQTQQA